GAGVRPAAFQREQHALAELGVEHALADPQAAVFLADLGLHGLGHGRLAPGGLLTIARVARADHALEPGSFLPGLLVLAGITRAEALVARREPLQRLFRQLVEEAALDVVAGLAMQHAGLAERKVEALAGTRDRHIHQAALLLEPIA